MPEGWRAGGETGNLESPSSRRLGARRSPCLRFQATSLSWASVEKVRNVLDLLGSCRLEGQQEDVEKELNRPTPLLSREEIFIKGTPGLLALQLKI